MPCPSEALLLKPTQPMLARISGKLHVNGASRALFFEFHPYYSTNAAAAAKPHNGFLEEYLMESLGFSKEGALSTCSKVIRLKPIRKDPALVVNFLENLGLSKTHIKSIISTNPNLLLCNVDKTLKPKILFLQELGISGSDFVKFIMAHKSLLTRGLDHHIKPRVEYLRTLLGTDDRVAIVLKKWPPLLGYDAPQTVAQNVLSLRKIGFSHDNVVRFLVRNSGHIMQHKDGRFEDLAHRVENDLGIRRDSNMFYYGVEILCKFRKSTIDRKVCILKSFGWPDEDVSRIIRTFPFIVTLSATKLRGALHFLMKELGYTPDYLASHHSFFSLNLENRVKLRNEVLKILNQKKLNRKKRDLYHVVRLPESKFVSDYLLPYKDEIPDVYRSYLEAVNLKIEN